MKFGIIREDGVTEEDVKKAKEMEKNGLSPDMALTGYKMLMMMVKALSEKIGMTPEELYTAAMDRNTSDWLIRLNKAQNKYNQENDL